MEEPCARQFVTGELGGEELEGDPSAEARVLGELNLAHAALAEFLDDLVVGDRLTEHRPLQVTEFREVR